MADRKLFYIVLCLLVMVSCKKSSELVPENSLEKDTQNLKRIFRVLDRLGANMDSTMDLFSDDLVHIAQGSRAITNKTDLRKILERESSYGETKMVHELISIHSYPDMVLTRGSAKGTWTAPGGDAVRFETNNIITFHREKDGSLKIWQVIFNRVNLENYH